MALYTCVFSLSISPMMIVRIPALSWSYYLHQIGCMTNLPLSWNNGMHCMSFYVLMKRAPIGHFDSNANFSNQHIETWTSMAARSRRCIQTHFLRKNVLLFVSDSQIKESICSISHNVPFRTDMCTFLFWMGHCGIWNKCILGFVNYVNWSSHSALVDTTARCRKKTILRNDNCHNANFVVTCSTRIRKLLPEPILTYCRMNLQEQMPVNL